MDERSSPSQKSESEHPSQEGFRKILVGFDGSEHSTEALGVACVLARKYDAGVVVVNVFSSPVYAAMGTMIPVAGMEAVEETAKKRAEELVGKAVGIAKGEGAEVTGEVLKAASAVQAITEYALANDIDLIVLGTRGLTGFKRMLLGSVSSGVVTHAHCSVLVVR
ncbi:MAG: universal stress protein [Nitrososphaerales archaeon]|nr:universal stress protein [Nitrososphaerales archaeon]